MPRRLLPLVAAAGFIMSIGSVNPVLAQMVDKESTPGDFGQAPLPKGFELRDQNSTFRWLFQEFSFEDVWTVDGTDNLYNQKVFFNFGSPNTPEVSFSSFEFLSFSESEVGNSAKASFLGFNDQLQIDIKATLVGGESASGIAQLHESYALTNLTDQTQDVSFFTYYDFDVGGSFDDDTTVFADNRIIQKDSGGFAMITSEQTPDFYEVDEYFLLLAKFFDDTPTQLSQPENATTEPLRDKDGTAALQFNQQLEAGESVTFNFYKELRQSKAPNPSPPKAVPEPALTLAILGVGSYLLARNKRA